MRIPKLAIAAALACAAAPASASAALDFTPCTDTGFECAKQTVPLDYDQPNGAKLKIAVTRLPAADQAHKIGVLLVNYGGPGGDGVASTQDFGADLFAAYHQRFDLIGFDPRGTGQSQAPLDCKVNQETQGIYRMPFTTPLNFDPVEELAKANYYARRCERLNPLLASHVSTANVARDMNEIRRSLGVGRINYFGFSYGTFLGATYASLFPTRYRAMVLDGALNARTYINKPMEDLRAQTAGFERALQRYFAACAPHPDYCAWMGGEEPETAYDDIIDAADAHPLPAEDEDFTGGDNRAVDGDTINNGTFITLYSKFNWELLTLALNQAAAGDGSVFRFLSDFSYGDNGDGTYDPGLDRYFMIGAAEQQYAADPDVYFTAGEASWDTSDHFWNNNGYIELNYGVYKPQDTDAYLGPFSVPGSAPTPLVVGTTYDPATVYRQARGLVHDLGNARLLTMKGDGHTAYGGNSACIDQAVDRYVIQLKLPAEGRKCKQQVAFPPPPEPAGDARRPQARPAVPAGRFGRPQR